VACHHCDVEVDSASNTVQECPVWTVERALLIETIRENLSAGEACAERDRERISSFSEAIMVRKEAERKKERGGRGTPEALSRRDPPLVDSRAVSSPPLRRHVLRSR